MFVVCNIVQYSILLLLFIYFFTGISREYISGYEFLFSDFLNMFTVSMYLYDCDRVG